MQRDMYCHTPSGEYGIRFMLDRLRQHRLKGVFFVEALWGVVVGMEYLAETVSTIVDGQGDVQLHLHPEWLARVPNSVLPGRTGTGMNDFSEDEQAVLIANGAEALRACGAKNVCAFRAGGFRANYDTLRALARHGFAFDTSHNACWMGVTCDLPTQTPLLQPQMLCGIHEFPISFFRAWPNQQRHAQLGACSSGELRDALLHAVRAGWHYFVILLHSFELVKRPCSPDPKAFPDRIAIGRFEDLCKFLADNADQFRTTTFADLDPDRVTSPKPVGPLRCRAVHTLRRHIEQAIRRLP
jgi:hypothetical protein